MKYSSKLSQGDKRPFAPGPQRLSAREHLKENILRAASNLGLLLYRYHGPRYTDRFSILTYHRIAEPVSGVPSPTINVTAARMRRQLTQLLERGYVFWPLKKLIAFRNRGWRIPPYVSAITFDDGFAGVYANAWPLLREFGLPATVFVNTAYLDSGDPMPFDHWGLAYGNQAPPEAYRPLTLAQCREMAATGLVDIGSHTHTHQDFRRRPQALEDDLRTSVAALRAWFDQTQITFAFPYGAPKLGFAHPDQIAAARRAGVACALTTASDVIAPQCDPFHWGRFHVFDWDSGGTLAAKMGGWYSWAPRAWGRIRGGKKSSCLLPAAKPVAEGVQRDSGDRITLGGNRLDDAMAIDRRSAEDPQGSKGRETVKDMISVVIPTYNRAHWLSGALESLVKQQTGGRFEYELIVVDNNSSDDTARVIKEFTDKYPHQVRYFHQLEPGDAPTRNCGLAHAGGNWIAFFDDDQLAHPDWLQQLLTAARFLDARIVGGAVHLDLPDKTLRELGPICREALREIDYHDQYHPYINDELPGTNTALVSRDVFEQIGMFDETMATGGSDTDFFMKARRAGIGLWYAHRAIIRHRIAANRLMPEYFRWDAIQGGACHNARFDMGAYGGRVLPFFCIARLAQALLVNAPLMLKARLRGNMGEALGRKTRLWRAWGYTRMTLAVLLPHIFPEKRFLEALAFRNSRLLETFGTLESGATETGPASDPMCTAKG
jgi:GT2 family glycosyltransferase/peptidoglycan/xylan/chitin deacetylase (PgdA/CDA1 family)